MFDSLRKIFGKGSKDEREESRTNLLDEELDQVEKELQESIHYMEERTSHTGPPAVQQPKELSVGGAIASPSLITPEEQKKIQEN